MAITASHKKPGYLSFKEDLDRLLSGLCSEKPPFNLYFFDFKDAYFETFITRKLKKAGYTIIRLEQEAVSKGRWFELQMPSLFQEKQIFIIRKIKASFLEDFLNLQVKSKVIYPAIFFLDEKLGKLEKKLNSSSQCYLSAPKIKPYEMHHAIVHLAKELGLLLEDSLIRYLADSFMPLSQLDAQLSKLSLFDELKQKKITYDIATRYINILPSEEVFQIDRLLLEQKQAEASALVFRLLKDGESPLSILGVLARYFRLCLQLHGLKNMMPIDNIATRLSLPLFVVQSYIKACTHISPASCKRALIKCASADEFFKSRSICPQVLLEEILDENRI